MPQHYSGFSPAGFGYCVHHLHLGWICGIGDSSMTIIDDAHDIGFDDGHLAGEYANPFDKETETDEWLSYKEGFEAGTELFFAEESTPLSEQIALADG